jgi:periplasmic protein TonB
MSETSARIPNPTKPIQQTVLIGRLESPAAQSRMKTFISNFRDFLLERPVKWRGKPPAFAPAEFGSGLGENLKEFFKPSPRGQIRSGLLINWTGGASLWQNVRDLIRPPKLPPLEVTSKPVDVPEIWSKDTQFTRVQALSIAFHVLVLVLLIAPLIPGLISPATTKASDVNVTPLDVSPYLPKLPAAAKRAGGGGGGGAHDVLPASRGKVPKFNWTQLTPPSVHPVENPKLAVPPTVLGPPQLNLPNPNAQNWGDPLAKLTNDSNGPGSGGGIGSGSGGGVGSGTGGGVGPGYGYGTGGGYPSAGTGGYGYPSCLYCPPPQFSDEAVKAKYQGVVYLTVVITPEGRATDIHVAKGLGLGLDEKAVEAVRNWRFKPAVGPDGKPSAVITTVEVQFRLF